MENLANYRGQIFENSEEEVNYDVDDSSLVVPPSFVAETRMDYEVPMTKEQFIIFLDLFDAACEKEAGDNPDQQEGSSSMGQNTFNSAFHATSEAIPTNIVEGRIQNGNLPDILDHQGENADIYDGLEGTIQNGNYLDLSDNQGQNAHFYDAAETRMDYEVPMTKEQFIIFLDLFDAACEKEAGDNPDQQEGSSSMGQNTFNSAFHATSEAIPTNIVEGRIQNGNLPDILDHQGENADIYDGLEGTIQNGNYLDLSDNQGQNAHFYDAAQGGISLNQQESSIFTPNYGTPDLPMLPWSQEIPQGDQLDQFLLPSFVHNSSADASTMPPESSSTALGLQQKSDVQQLDQASQMSNSLEPIPILAKSKSKIAMSTPDTGSASQYPSQGSPTLGSTSTDQALAQTFSWPSQQLSPVGSIYPSQGSPIQGSTSTDQALVQTFSWPCQQLSPVGSSWSPQELALGSTYRGLTLGSSSNPGALTIGPSWNATEIDLSSWASTTPARQGLGGINASPLATRPNSSSTNTASQARQGLGSIYSSPLATRATSSSTNIRRGGTWEADATATHRLLDLAPQNDRNLFRTRPNQYLTYDSRYADLGQFVDPFLRVFAASGEFQAAGENLLRNANGRSGSDS